MFQSLAGNLAMVALFITAWCHAHSWVKSLPIAARPMAFGLFMGAGAIASMTMSIQLEPGIYADLRATLLVVSGFIGGPAAAMVCFAMAVICRLLMGGSGVVPGIGGIALATCVGLVATPFTLHRVPLLSLRQIFRRSLAIGAVSTLSLLTMWQLLNTETLLVVGSAVAVLNVVATAFASIVIVRAYRAAMERDLLMAALSQAPDLAYVKDTQSRFAATNDAVARINGYANSRDILGLSDFDFEPAERARVLFEAEQQLLSSGEAITDLEEYLVDRDGEHRWYCTSKVVLHNSDDQVIGLMGVTRDITAEKRLRRELLDNRNQLSYAMTEMADGLAMFDADDNLVFCNDQYRLTFPLTWDLRQPGINLRTILEAVAETGEQVLPEGKDPKVWIEEVMAALHTDSEEEAQLYDGRWMHIRTRFTSDGASMVVVSDVTKLKQAEVALLSAAEQLKLLADTDGLTGLVNRRAFDKALDNEVARSARSRSPLSLVMIDVDHFKAYNDMYGHPAGDECLRIVSKCLTDTLKRPADIVARYGGEEFVAILPDTDEDGAYFIAQEFRKALKDLRIPHEGCPKKIVTASVGIATYGQGSYIRYATELVSMADEALYGAKAAGRDRINGWQAKVEPRSTGTHGR